MSRYERWADSARDGARIKLDQDAFHATEDGYFIDCPECGSPISISRIVQRGTCTGKLKTEMTEVVSEEHETLSGTCTASLSLNLVWEE